MTQPDPITVERLGLTIDSHSFVPYYVQIVDHVRELIMKNKLSQGQTFCSEGEIAQALKVSKMPVRQAFQKLRSEGLLVIAKGKRPIVGSGRVPWNFQQLRGFSEEMRRRGLTPSARLLSMELEDPELEVAQALKLTPGERVYRIRRLRSVNEEPVAVVTSYLPARIFLGIDKLDLEKQSLYAIFENSYKRRLQWAEEGIGAVIAGEDEAEVLQTSVGSALLIIKETTYDTQNVAIEYSVSLLRGDRYTASVISVRKPEVGIGKAALRT
ncbi:MAG: GntR family transcriptional regulator [Candidatus Sulfotelmatobacter sp.]